MKYWTIVAGAVVVAVFLVAGCTPKADLAAYVGTWINPGNDGRGAAGPPGKIVITANTFTMYENSTASSSDTPTGTGSYQERDAWDSGNEHYFKIELAPSPQPGVTYYMLACLIDNTLRMEGSDTGYPLSLSTDPKTIWTRQ